MYLQHSYLEADVRNSVGSNLIGRTYIETTDIGGLNLMVAHNVNSDGSSKDVRAGIRRLKLAANTKLGTRKRRKIR